MDKLAQVLTQYRTSTPIISGSNSQKIKSGKLRVVFNGTGKTRKIHWSYQSYLSCYQKCLKKPLRQVESLCFESVTFYILYSTC